jgi:hypothetical protein
VRFVERNNSTRRHVLLNKVSDAHGSPFAQELLLFVCHLGRIAALGEIVNVELVDVVLGALLASNDLRAR